MLIPVFLCVKKKSATPPRVSDDSSQMKGRISFRMKKIKKEAKFSVCEVLRRLLLALGARDVWGGIQGRNQDSVFLSELEAEQKDYVTLPPAAVTLIKISAKFATLMSISL